MTKAGINFVLQYPEQFLAYIDSKELPVFHKSNVFFRDFQYALWRFLNESQTKVSYADMENLAKDVVDAFEQRGILRKINRQSFELNMPAFTTIFPTAEQAKAAPTPKAATAPKPAAAPPKPASGAASAGTTAAPGGPVTVEAAKAMSEGEKAAKLAEIKQKMEEAKARRLAGS